MSSPGMRELPVAGTHMNQMDGKTVPNWLKFEGKSIMKELKFLILIILGGEEMRCKSIRLDLVHDTRWLPPT